MTKPTAPPARPVSKADAKVENSSELLVEHFEPRPGTFRLGMKPLNTKSVKAAHGDPNKVIRVVARHLTREIRAEADVTSGRISPHLTPENYVLVGASRAHGIEAAFMSQLTGAEIRVPVRRDCIMAIELVFSVPPDTTVDIHAYFRDCVAWAQNEFQPAPIISAIVHLDEACPHMHVLIVPIVNGSMQGGKLFGYRGAFNRRNSDFHDAVGKKHGLARPTSKLTLSAAARKAYAFRLIDEIAGNPSVLLNNSAARKALLKLIAADPVQLARALNLSLSNGDALVQDSAATNAGTAPSAATVVPCELLDNTVLLGAPTSCLCYDVQDEPAEQTAQQPVDHPPVSAAVRIDGYEETRAGICAIKPAPFGTMQSTGSVWLTADAHRATRHEHEQVPQPDDEAFVYDREDEHLASTWNEELGCHVEPATISATNRAKAASAVAAALNGLAGVRRAAPARAFDTLPSQGDELDV